ncbi:DUF4397 domain-containing protein [Clostridium fallax]|uniref:DUF4397 domain-containing protein n=1 Tax=Clostridium fallax TaxID=1533 RepID=A0A1M4VUU1_9CLOT|nr:DUF4397 domain-containing protein [Clostridium fallax]SHE72603.1 protein of unknown function [Clostridium fallax]SQB07700.1 Uncharacterised protein [Clostridium fallax]
MFFSNALNYTNSLPIIKSYVRLLHASPDSPSVDVYMSGKLIASNISFGEHTNYFEIAPDDYNVEIYLSGKKDTPLFSKYIEIYPKSYFTIGIINMFEDIDLRRILDGSSGNNQNISFLRFIHYSPKAPLLNLSLGRVKTLFKFMEYRESSGYYPLSPGIYTFNLSASNASFLSFPIPNIKLKPNKFYTIYSIGLTLDNPRIRTIILEDGNFTK